MSTSAPLDCVVIGYNETPFEEYEALLRQYGTRSEAYRDLKGSFVWLDGRPLTYPSLMNEAYHGATSADAERCDPFKSGEIPNLAAVYLVNYLRRRGLAATHVNLFQFEQRRLAELLSDDVRTVAITTTFYLLNLPVVEIVDFVRARSPETKIIVGGPLIANHSRRFSGEALEAALDDIGADIYVIESQGEATLARVLESLARRDPLERIPNLGVSSGQGVTFTNRMPEQNSLDDNYIDWTMFRDEELGPTLQTRTARSCAFSCAFCGYPARAGKLSLASLDTVEKELDAMRALGDTRNVVFIDDTFNVPLPRFKDICRLMIRKHYGFEWFSYLRCGNADEEAVELMAQSGCKGVFLGIESGSPQILKNMHKAATVEQYARGMEWLRQHEILSFASFIVGFPGETHETMNETIDFIRANQPDYYRGQAWYCEPGTPIYAQRDEYGITGSGFKWRHDSMSSEEAMDGVERMFRTITESLWLPQWSFDFWIIPYVLGKGMSLDAFKSFMTEANRLLALEIDPVSPDERRAAQGPIVESLVERARTWQLTPAPQETQRRLVEAAS